MPTFKQKQYRALAEFIRDLNYSETRREQLAEALARLFERDNAKFSRDKWQRACEVSS